MTKTELQKLRARYGFTALRLAQAAGTTEGRVFQIERGRFRPRSEEARELARVLGVRVNELFPGGVQSHEEELRTQGELL